MTPDLFTHAAAHTATTAMLASRSINGVSFHVYEGETVRTITPPGRVAWALGELIAAAGRGITSLENPAPRLAAYIHKAKRVYGLNIESITEMHDGPYPGKHARYRLHTRVEFADRANATRQKGGDQ
jgi:hypothetical protein